MISIPVQEPKKINASINPNILSGIRHWQRVIRDEMVSLECANFDVTRPSYLQCSKDTDQVLVNLLLNHPEVSSCGITYEIQFVQCNKRTICFHHDNKKFIKKVTGQILAAVDGVDVILGIND